MAGKREVRDLLDRAGTEGALAEGLAIYGAFLLNANELVNLTGAKTPAALVPHLLDSLTAAPFVDAPLVDVGSGGGLPGIPLAIATGIEVTLIEATAKKARFLEAALAELGLAGRVVARRAEDAAHDPGLRGRFESGTCRAVGSAPSVAELLLPFLAPGGLGILQRGGLSERERNAVADAALMLGGRLEREEPLAGDRRILLVRKTGPTPGRFPRPSGIPTKRPLCM